MADCIVCGLADCKEMVSHGDISTFNCKRCGKYEISSSLYAALKYDKNKLPHTASAWIREQNSINGKPPVLMSDDFEMLQTITDKTISSKFERFMKEILVQYEKVNDTVILDLNIKPSWISITWVKNDGELKSIIEEGFRQGFIEGEIPTIGMYEGTNPYRWRAHIRTVTFQGREYIESLKNIGGHSNKIFMAFHFTDEMKESFEVTAKRAVTDASGGKLEAVRVSTSGTPTDTKIDDELIAMLKASKVVIADFTGQRQAVYYEAGYAMGMGIPVIWTCRADHVQDLSFDTRQYPHILWEDEEDLYKQLTDRLTARYI
ncbi:hypothetical protein E0765_04895 [Sulfuricurvum sp. IAE1]|uniref:hypothetical protein n=1 Tax=Sulfuricurvum sp. IAE1 TaxID=2546102 RepID=UPI0010456E3C|nr:hypothetical protein [Sulfuricurvum sp. IAE1]TDA65567.1 hypothetical protein E0765_04895 [Sulfuricurvum sp. IAE1]